MNHAQNLDLPFEIVVRDDIGQAGNDKLASLFDPARPAKARMRFELCDLALDCVVMCCMSQLAFINSSDFHKVLQKAKL